MNTSESTDEALRSQIKATDPHPEQPPAQAVDSAWERILAGDASQPEPTRRRRWLDLAVAACLGAALVGGGVIVTGNLTSGGSDSSIASDAPATMDSAVAEGAAPADAAKAADDQQSSPTLARDASAVVATEDLRAARDSFVATVNQLNGTVTSESTTTGPDDPMTTTTDMAIYPPVPVTPGISLSVEVPADAYDQAVAAAAGLGDVVQFTQSSQEVGAEYTQGKARIASLRASLATLRGLMDEATSISDVIALEDAIAQRQADLDALTSQQRYLEGLVSQARISLQLITPSDASALYDTTPTWWEQVGHALATAWAWLGRALLWTSPVWIAVLLWWGWRRRRV